MCSLFLLAESVEAQGFAYYQQMNSLENNVKPGRVGISGGLFVGTIGVFVASINEAYYQDRRVKFHFARNSTGSIFYFDNYHREMDKFGHLWSTSMFSQNFYFLARWSGFNHKSSAIIGAGGAFLIMTGMEVFDGHYESWGFSVGDFVANTFGAIFPVIQFGSPFLQNFDYKMSYNFLNDVSPQAGIHDYENMTFWFSVNPRGLLASKSPSWLPGFLNIAVGAGLESYVTQRRELFISLDYNLKRIKTGSMLLNHILAVADRFHLPAPAIRISPTFVGYGLFF
ncbi:MAG: DUF2279 domain-containing protein [Calditrichia bacterium]